MKSIILMGMKHSGKSSLSRRLAWLWKIRSVDLDELIEGIYRPDRAVSCREIYRQHGEEYFRGLEAQAAQKLANIASSEAVCASLGGGTIENQKAMVSLKGAGLLVYLKADADELFSRIIHGGIPSYLKSDNPSEEFLALYDKRTPLYEKASDMTISVNGMSLEDAFNTLTEKLKEHGYAG